jgi:inosine-uridine nucleoside N-ribohydrolase
MVLHDPLAVGLAIDPSLAEWEPVRLTIGPDGQTRRSPGEANSRFARIVDTPRFLSMFLERLCQGC